MHHLLLQISFHFSIHFSILWRWLAAPKHSIEPQVGNLQLIFVNIPSFISVWSCRRVTKPEINTKLAIECIKSCTFGYHEAIYETTLQNDFYIIKSHMISVVQKTHVA